LQRHGLSADAIAFACIDVYDRATLDQTLPQYDLVINMAGPFQGLEERTVLNVCMEHGPKYLDVCDDINLSRINRKPDPQTIARRTGGSAVISTGI